MKDFLDKAAKPVLEEQWETFRLFCIYYDIETDENITVRGYLGIMIPFLLTHFFAFLVAIFLVPGIMYALISHFGTFEMTYWSAFVIFNLAYLLYNAIKKIIKIIGGFK